MTKEEARAVMGRVQVFRSATDEKQKDDAFAMLCLSIEIIASRRVADALGQLINSCDRRAIADQQAEAERALTPSASEAPK